MDYEKDFQDAVLSTKYGNVHYKTHGGTGNSLVLIHGLASSARTWARLMGYLPDEMDIYALDMLGHGESDAPEIKYSVVVQVEVLRELAVRCGLYDAFIFGHSYGGWVAAAYAEMYETGGIILEDSAGLREFYEEVRGDENRQRYKEDILRKSVALGGRSYVVKSILDDEFVEGQLEAKDMKRINTPTLILWGSEDEVVNVKYASVFAERIPGSRVGIIGGARHTPHYTHAQEVSRQLLEFMDTGRESRSTVAVSP